MVQLPAVFGFPPSRLPLRLDILDLLGKCGADVRERISENCRF